MRITIGASKGGLVAQVRFAESALRALLTVPPKAVLDTEVPLCRNGKPVVCVSLRGIERVYRHDGRLPVE